MASTARRDFWDRMHAERPDEPSSVVEIRPRDERPADSPRRRRRPVRALLRFLVTVGIGIGGTLAWQAYGDMAREIAAAAYPEQLGWLKPFSTPTRSLATTASGAGPTAASSALPVQTADQQQLAAVSLSLAGIRQRVEELAAQVTFNQQQGAASQQQMAAEIQRLQASEQEVLAKLAAPPRPPRPAAPAHKPAPLALNPVPPPPSASAAATQ